MTKLKLMKLWVSILFIFLYINTFGWIESANAININNSALIQEELTQGEKIAKKAFKAAQRGNFAQAEIYWTTLISEFPENPAVWSNRGNVRVGQYKLAEA
ncbi:MAG: hypothetical protein AAFY76_12560, partial [Cyanobacteria bacterium J06649_11]